jgi:hypothetical protein
MKQKKKEKKKKKRVITQMLTCKYANRRGWGVDGNQICATTRRSYVIEHATESERDFRQADKK